MPSRPALLDARRIGHPRPRLVPIASPDVLVAILRSARSASPDPRLDQVLAALRREWEGLGRRRYPGLGDGLDDALQMALLKVIAPEKLDGLKDPSRIGPWARSIFIHAVMDVARDLKRHRGQRLAVGPDEDAEDVLRDRIPTVDPTPEERASGRERLTIVAGVIGRLEVARLRFVDGLPEKDIAERLQLSRDGVAGQLKRIRKAIRNALDDPE
jgi:RNA polymerase sigma factor (sigma-70 family)